MPRRSVSRGLPRGAVERHRVVRGDETNTFVLCPAASKLSRGRPTSGWTRTHRCRTAGAFTALVLRCEKQ